MATMSVRDMQTALVRAGFDVGTAGVDGIWGRDSIDATKRFQRALGLPGGGTPGPGTVAGMETILGGGNLAAAIAASRKAVNSPMQMGVTTTPVWYLEAERRMGLHETRNKKTLWDWLKSDGRQLGDPSKLPWCGDFVDTAIARTLPQEKMLDNPYWAQNWAKWGQPLSKPSFGAILVFSRDGGGHVAFCAGADSGTGGYFAVLGGNQSNGVSIMRIEKRRLVKNGIRWPTTAPLPTTYLLASAQGAISRNEA